MTRHTHDPGVMPHGRASASEPDGYGARGRSPRNEHGMTAASCVLRWGGGVG
jgi:hypothetical protein